MMAKAKPRQIPALKVRQWLPGWDNIDFDTSEYRAKPLPHFYIFSLPARELRSLSGIVRREAKSAQPRTDDLGIQRQHDRKRSEEIGRFVDYGYPWSTLSEAKRSSREFNDLRKPGWLPTAVVLNILTKGSERAGTRIDNRDVAKMLDAEEICTLQLPYEKWTASWSPTKLPPFEVIDGQHRLWAFDENSKADDFELPVVEFEGLDISWQAYLFWTINIKPKRINSSLAFDLYPLLRSEDWLDRAEGHSIYRETRAQELTEILWAHPSSPWYDRINMLGERGVPWVSQSAWVKSLIATFVRSWDRRANKSGGLFGGRSKQTNELLGWSRGQQSAFLIFIWNVLRTAVADSKADWATNLRQQPEAKTFEDDFAFYGPYTLIATDQGVRGYLHVVNDLCYLRAAALKLNNWLPNEQGESDPINSVEEDLESLAGQNFVDFLSSIGRSLAGFDWRTSSAPGLEEPERRAKLVFRGSGGYKELRTQLLEHLAKGKGEVAEASKRIVDVTQT